MGRSPNKHLTDLILGQPFVWIHSFGFILTKNTRREQAKAYDC